MSILRLSVVVLAWLPTVAMAAAVDCGDAQKAFHETPTDIVKASEYIGCLELALAAATTLPPGPSPSASSSEEPASPLIGGDPEWTPTAFPGLGTKPNLPTADKIQNYLRWVLNQYQPDDSAWPTAVNATLPKDMFVGRFTPSIAATGVKSLLQLGVNGIWNAVPNVTTQSLTDDSKVPTIDISKLGVLSNQSDAITYHALPPATAGQ